MNLWLGISLFLVLILVILVALVYPRLYQRAIKTGEDRFLKFLLQNGFKQRVEDFATLNQVVEPGGIVFVGDSITQEFHLHEYFPNLPIYNRGIGGDTTAGLLTRMDESIFALKPSTIVLQMGTNDFPVSGLEADVSIANLTKVVNQIKHTLPQTKLILVSVYPIHEPTLNLGQPILEKQRTNVRLIRINEGIQQLEGIEFVDLYHHLLDQQNQLNMTLSRDGLHLNAKGYQVVQNVLAPYLKPIR
jgi:lysophospholipase L1-like esterase